MRIACVVILAAGAFVASGCGGTPSNGATDGGGGLGGGGGGSGGGGGGGGSADAAGIAQLVAGVTQNGTSVTANFLEYASAITPPPTDLMTLGACKLQSLPTPSYATPTPHSGGNVTFAIGAQTVATLTPTMPSMYSLYTAFTSTMPLWSGGETLTFTVAGADAPAFTATAVAPSVVQFTQPPPNTTGATVMFDRSQDFTVAWTGGSGGDVRVLIAANESGMPGVYQLELDCRFPSTAGTATIPTATLQHLPANAMGFYDLHGSGSSTMMVGGWLVEVDVESTYDNGAITGATIMTN